MAVLLVSTVVFAEEKATVAIDAPKDLVATVCPSPIWNKFQVVWDGVKDDRTSPEVGVQTKKGDETILVYSEKPLTEVFDAPLKEIFTKCGMVLKTSGDDEATHLSATIREFSANVEKKIVSGKGEAVSSIKFSLKKPGNVSDVTVGYGTETKGVRQKDIKQLKKILDELFAGTLKQIPTVQEIKDFK